MIRSIDNEIANQHQKDAISLTICNQCSSKYVQGQNVVFVDTDTKVIWWHQISRNGFRCTDLYGTIPKIGLNKRNYMKEWHKKNKKKNG